MVEQQLPQLLNISITTPRHTEKNNYLHTPIKFSDCFLYLSIYTDIHNTNTVEEKVPFHFIKYALQ